MFLAFFVIGCDSLKSEDATNTTSTESEYDDSSYMKSSTVEPSQAQHVPGTSYAGHGTGYSYWYVYVQTGSDVERFAILRLDQPDFSLVQAIKTIRQIWPSIKDDDYVGIKFFCSVTEACFMEYWQERK